MANKGRTAVSLTALALFLKALFILTSCDNDPKPDPKPEPEKPMERTGEITFAFKDGEGAALDGTYKAGVQGTMLLADWNNATAATRTGIESAQHNASNRFERSDFVNIFGENDTTIIFGPNTGNSKLEVKEGEFQNLYLDPTKLNGITDADFKAAVNAMRNETSITVALMKMPLNVRVFAQSVIAQLKTSKKQARGKEEFAAAGAGDKPVAKHDRNFSKKHRDAQAIYASAMRAQYKQRQI